MAHSFDPEQWYKSDRDGSLEDYLKTHDGISAFPLFKGYEYYQILWNKGLLVPDFSYIRLMHNVGRGDEHFLVRGEFKIEGLRAQDHSGRPGIHDPREILEEGPPWEAQHLSPTPRKEKSN